MPGSQGVRVQMYAAALALGTLAVLALIAVISGPLAERLSVEDGAFEWLQVLLYGGSALLFARYLVRTADRRVSPLDVLAVAALVGLVIGEIDLDRRVFGTKVIATKFFVDSSVALPWRVLAVLVVVGVPAVLAIYALLRVRVLWRDGWAALDQPWGRVLAASTALLLLTELVERHLRVVPGVPRYFIEESLELVAALGIFVAAAARR
jgi:hypothetical protein